MIVLSLRCLVYQTVILKHHITHHITSSHITHHTSHITHHTSSQNHYGHEHPEVAAVLVNLGNAHGALGDALKKKELLVTALRIQEEAASRFVHTLAD